MNYGLLDCMMLWVGTSKLLYFNDIKMDWVDVAKIIKEIEDNTFVEWADLRVISQILLNYNKEGN